MKYLFPILILISILSVACKSSKKISQIQHPIETTATEEARVSNDIPSFLAKMVRDTRKAEDNSQSIKIDMFEKDGQQYYGYNNCNGCADAMTVIYDISGKKVANCGGFAGFRGEYCEALSKAKTMYKSQNGKILIDEWKLGE